MIPLGGTARPPASATPSTHAIDEGLRPHRRGCARVCPQLNAGKRPTTASCPVTRWVAIAVIPFLVIAAFLLFVFPTRTGELFAWPIAPPLSAFLLASAYVGGIWFFVGIARARAWHHVRRGFPAVVVFAGALLVATLLHLDRFSANLPFSRGSPCTRPRRSSSPRSRSCSDLATPAPRIRWMSSSPASARIGLAVVGACALVAGAVIFLAPQARGASSGRGSSRR